VRRDRLSGILLLAPLLASSACFQGERLILVNGDGSGKIVDTLVPGAQMKALADLARNDAKADSRKKGDAAAAAMGPGVTFLGEEKTPEGGFRTSYAFKDVGALKVDVSPGPDSDDQRSGPKPKPMTFRFARAGDRATLTVVLPRPQKVQAPPSGAPGAELAQGIWAMMRGFLKGLKLETSVQVAGDLLHTTSPYAKGSTVTLLRMDFDRITADDATFQKFTEAGADPSELDPKLLQGVPGVEVAPDSEVVLEFKPRK
jgi:hypothetical protein